MENNYELLIKYQGLGKFFLIGIEKTFRNGKIKNVSFPLWK